METKILFVSGCNCKIRLVSFLDKADLLSSKDKFINKVTNELKSLDNKDDFAGFIDEEKFKNYIGYNIFDNPKTIAYPSDKINLEKLAHCLEEALEKIKVFLSEKTIKIFIFPTNSKFVLEKMNGSSGRLIWKNVIYINVHPKKDWQKNVKSTLAHEIAHNLQAEYSYDMTIGDAIIFEGIAENFQEHFIGEVENPWAHLLSKNEAGHFLKIMVSLLKNKYTDSYKEVFYGTGEYPLWMGYSIGYHLVKDYLLRSKISWKKLFLLKPNIILKESGWL